MRLAELLDVIDTDQIIYVVYEPIEESRLVIVDDTVENVIRLLEYGLIHPFLYVTGVYVDSDDAMNIYVKKELPCDE